MEPTAETTEPSASNGIEPRRRVLALFCLALAVAAACAMAHYTAGIANSSAQHSRLDLDADTSAASRAMYAAMEALGYLWVFCLGATVASFLNVVVYRLPAGMEVVKEPSHCPVCQARIAALDNVPIVGWLKLRGRCRNCRCTISPRYPLVETFFALLVLALATTELFTGGANLPLRPPSPYSGVIFILWSAKWDIIGLFIFHCVMLGYLTVVALMHWDDERAPTRLLFGGLAIGMLAPVVWPELRLTPGWTPAGALPHRSSLYAALDGLVSLLAGLSAGALGQLAAGDWPTRRRDRAGEIALGGLVGVYVGWHATLQIALLAAMFAMVASTLGSVPAGSGRRDLPASMPFAFATATFLFWWRDAGRILSPSFGKPGVGASALWLLALFGSYAATRALAGGRFGCRRQ